jgi:hypothetical protein
LTWFSDNQSKKNKNMKQTILTLLLVSAAVAVHGQGSVVFNNRVTGTVVAPIYGPQVGTPGVRQTGNTSTGTPAGSTVYTGTLLQGTGFTAQLWGGPNGTAEGALTLATGSQTTFRTGTAAGFITAPAVNPTVTGVPENGTATLQVRVWDNQGGTITSYAQALQVGAAAGFSDLFNVSPLGGTLTPSPNIAGLRSFSLTQVPEPSVIALGALGLGALLFRRIRK